MDNKDADIISPVDMRASNSLLSGDLLISLAIFIKSSVVSPMAETTTTILGFFFFLSTNLLAISLILSVLDTELPPYFCTTTLLNFIPPENSLLT